MDSELFWQLYLDGDMTIESIDPSIHFVDPLTNDYILHLNITGKLKQPVEYVTFTVKLEE